MFLIYCTNKGCFKNTEAVVDLSDNEVYCADCGGMISNLTIFTKAQLKNLKQVRKPVKESFSTKCHSCGVEARPKLVSDKLCCIKCGIHLVNIPKSFEMLTREAIKNKEDI